MRKVTDTQAKKIKGLTNASTKSFGLLNLRRAPENDLPSNVRIEVASWGVRNSTRA